MPESEQVESTSGGRSPIFATTHWSVILQSGDELSPAGNAALEKLCHTYWFPIYSFLRRQGRSEPDAKDLTQQFFSLLLKRRDFQRADASKGKFRTFLLVSLRNFLANEHDRNTAAKRGGGQAIFSLDAIPPDQFLQIEPASDLTPDKMYDRRWALRLLEEALRRLHEEMGAGGKAELFQALKPFLTEDPAAGDYGAVATKLGLTSQTVAVNVHRLRQRFRELVRAEVTQTVSCPTEVEEEMRHLHQALES